MDWIQLGRLNIEKRIVQVGEPQKATFYVERAQDGDV